MSKNRENKRTFFPRGSFKAGEHLKAIFWLGILVLTQISRSRLNSTTYLSSATFQNTKSLQLKSLYLEPLAS